MYSDDPMLELMGITLYDFILARTEFIAPTGCMEWKGIFGNIRNKDYGSVLIDKVYYPVHRWIVFNTPGNEIYDINDKNLFSCHIYDNPPCIGSHHLVIATPLWNSRDASAKGRLIRAPTIDDGYNDKYSTKANRNFHRKFPLNQRTQTRNPL